MRPILVFGALCFLFLLNLQAQERGMKTTVQEFSSEKRVALVIGNSTYKDAPLRNPVNDAQAMARALKTLGFEVLTGENLDQKDMKRIIREFGQHIKGSGVGLFYYAGHGIQSKGHNYLIPISADISKEQDIDLEGVDVQFALAEMDAAQNRMNIVILDACRNNPVGRSYRSADRGLAQMTAPTGTFIAYSTAPGSVAADGEGMLGLYTEQLLKYMTTTNLRLEELFKRVLGGVKKETNGKQIPWTASSVEGDFFFNYSSKEPLAVSEEKAEEQKPQTEGDVFREFKEKARQKGMQRQVIDDVIAKMQKDFDEATRLAQSDLSKQDKLAIWRLFMEQNKEDVANDERDDALREKALINRSILEDELGGFWNSLSMKFVLVLPGTFQMGKGDEGESEEGFHTVTITKPFLISRFEVTQTQWWTVMQKNPSFFSGDNNPVDNVSWNDVQEFIKRLGNLEGGQQYRLPTEAEWEFAARGGKSSQGYLWSGANEPSDVANFLMVSRERTSPVGQRKPNELGIFDMSGNVAEWCSDWFAAYGGTSMKDPQGPETGKDRVARGGSFSSRSDKCQIHGRAEYSPTEKHNDLGFRLVKTLK